MAQIPRCAKCGRAPKPDPFDWGLYKVMVKVDDYNSQLQVLCHNCACKALGLRETAPREEVAQHACGYVFFSGGIDFNVRASETSEHTTQLT